MVNIKEIFTSIQGEGPYIGYKQLFIRLCGCNLNCSYCDTDFTPNGSKEYTIQELITVCNGSLDCHSVSLTGGEPLLHIDFIKRFASECKIPIYLETNATLPDQLKEVIDLITFISADIKLPSASKNTPKWDVHDKFFKIASMKKVFAKAVFDKNITEDEIFKMTELCKKYNIELILQPKMNKNISDVDSVFMQKTLDKCLRLHSKTRLIPQVHKYINVM